MQQQHHPGATTWAPGAETQADLRALFERPPRIAADTLRGFFDKADATRDAMTTDERPPPEISLLRRTADTLWPPQQDAAERHALLTQLETPPVTPMELVEDVEDEKASKRYAEDEVIVVPPPTHSSEEEESSDEEDDDDESSSSSASEEEEDEYAMDASDNEYAPEKPGAPDADEKGDDEEESGSGSGSDSNDESSSSSDEEDDDDAVRVPDTETQSRPTLTPAAWTALFERVAGRLGAVAGAVAQGRAPKRARATVEPPVVTEAPLGFRRACEVLVGAWAHGKCGDQTMERQRVALGRLQTVRCNTPAAKNTKASLTEAYTTLWQYSVAPELNAALFPLV